MIGVGHSLLRGLKRESHAPFRHFSGLKLDEASNLCGAEIINQGPQSQNSATYQPNFCSHKHMHNKRRCICHSTNININITLLLPRQFTGIHSNISTPGIVQLAASKSCHHGSFVSLQSEHRHHGCVSDETNTGIPGRWELRWNGRRQRSEPTRFENGESKYVVPSVYIL